jgi:glycosyltransferase involved in cell wall biosynthesis
MRESLVFASMSCLEGLGLPPLEAMASGCLVCGFDGWGGREYARIENGLWVPDGDLESFAGAIARALEMEPEAADLQIRAGLETAKLFSEERFRRGLNSAWESLLGEAAERYRVVSSERTGDLKHVD